MPQTMEPFSDLYLQLWESSRELPRSAKMRRMMIFLSLRRLRRFSAILGARTHVGWKCCCIIFSLIKKSRNFFSSVCAWFLSSVTRIPCHSFHSTLASKICVNWMAPEFYNFPTKMHQNGAINDWKCFSSSCSGLSQKINRGTISFL